MVAAEKKKSSPRAPRGAATPSRAAASRAKAAAPTETSSPAVTVQPEAAHGQRRREAVGTVVSNKMQKTIVVKIDRRVRHPLYNKYVTRSRRFQAHDERNDAKMGDLVELIESRPLSRNKRWALKRVIRRATQTIEVSV